jgi:hypothetical protein
MRNIRELQPLIFERWPKLRKRAQSESDPEQLLTIIGDIHDLLFILEMRVSALKKERISSRTGSPFESA